MRAAVLVVPRPSCPEACGIFPDPGLNLYPSPALVGGFLTTESSGKSCTPFHPSRPSLRSNRQVCQWHPTALIEGSPPGSPVPGILQAKILEWVAISFSNA